MDQRGIGVRRLAFDLLDGFAVHVRVMVCAGEMAYEAVKDTVSPLLTFERQPFTSHRCRVPSLDEILSLPALFEYLTLTVPLFEVALVPSTTKLHCWSDTTRWTWLTVPLLTPLDELYLLTLSGHATVPL